jgi:hypothetical protein
MCKKTIILIVAFILSTNSYSDVGSDGTDGYKNVCTYIGSDGTDSVGSDGTDSVGSDGTDSVGSDGTDSVGSDGTDGIINNIYSTNQIICQTIKIN